MARRYVGGRARGALSAHCGGPREDAAGGRPRYGPTAFFSILDAKTRIPPHCGVTNTRLIVHVPLVIPEGCRFRVGSTTRPWRPGEAFVFDDTIEHEAWNDSDIPRAVLIFDIWNPYLSEAERELVRKLGKDSRTSIAANCRWKHSFEQATTTVRPDTSRLHASRRPRADRAGAEPVGAWGSSRRGARRDGAGLRGVVEDAERLARSIDGSCLRRPVPMPPNRRRRKRCSA